MRVSEAYSVLQPRPKSLKNRESIKIKMDIIASGPTENISRYTNFHGAFFPVEKVLEQSQ